MEVDATALVGRSFGFRNDNVNLQLHDHSTIKWIDGSKIRIFAIHNTPHVLKLEASTGPSKEGAHC